MVFRIENVRVDRRVKYERICYTLKTEFSLTTEGVFFES
jgi:hypothetical protein